MLPRAQLVLDFARGSTNIAYLCSLEHKSCLIVLLRAHISLVVLVEAQTRLLQIRLLCFRKHNQARMVLPRAQMSLVCARGSTTEHELCSGGPEAPP